MTNSLSLLGLLFSTFVSQSLGATEVSLYCHVPTTVFNVVSTNTDLVTSTVTHPYGIQFTPLYKGTIVASQAVQLNEKAQVLKSFGPSQTFIWPQENCRQLRPLIFTCSQGRPVEINGMVVNPVSLVTSMTTHELADYSYQILNVNLTFRIGSRIYNITADYQPNKDCQPTRTSNAK